MNKKQTPEASRRIQRWLIPSRAFLRRNFAKQFSGRRILEAKLPEPGGATLDKILARY